MANIHHTDDMKLIIEKIIDNQSKSFQTSLEEAQFFLDKQELEDFYLKTITPIFQVLETLHRENKIDNEQYLQRLLSLSQILQLVKDVIAIDTQNDHSDA